MTQRCDVLVLGGGPAGLATAIELRQKSDLKVVVVEPRAVPTERYGESLPPDILLSLDRLGLSATFRGDGHLPCPGSVSLWGSGQPGYNDFILNPLGPAWHISRTRFEAMLRARTVECGATLWTGRRAVDAIPSDDEGFDVTLTDSPTPTTRGVKATHRSGAGGRERSVGGRAVINASWVVDATGQRAWFARRQGAVRRNDERMVAVVRLATLQSETFTAQTLVESTSDGWWYCARLPSDRLATVFVTAPECARALLARDHLGWRAELDRTRLLAPRLAECVLDDEVLRAYAVRSSLLDQVEGHRWLAVGDAASSYDPIASRGIHTALTDAAGAATAILSATERATFAARAHSQQVRARFEEYRANRDHVYAQERRWSEQPFWRALNPVRTATSAEG